MQLTPRLVVMLATPPLMWACNAVVGRLAIESIGPLWLNALRRTFVDAETLYWAIRPLRDIDDIERALALSGVPVALDGLAHAA